MSPEIEGPANDAPVPEEPGYGRVRLTAGVLGRVWLWFLAGCLVVTLVPVLFGWRPYLIQSGSMEPRIQVGDVVIAAPEHDPQALLGRVTVFTDPDRPDRNKTHRVVQIADDGALVTKGDANPTPDSQHVAMSEVQGLGRLLVRFVGLPVIWAQTGQWLWLLLFGASVGLAVRWVSRDHESEPLDDSGEGGPGDGTDGDRRLLVADGSAVTKSGLDIAATRPSPLVRRARANRWAWRAGYATMLTVALVLPTSAAAFSATTKAAASTWAVPNYSYTAEVNGFHPYLYWKLGETNTSTGTAGRTAADSSGNGRDGQYNTNGGTAYFTKGTPGAISEDLPGGAVTLKNASSCINTKSTTLINSQTPVTVAIWFRAPSSYQSGGKLAGFEKPQTGVAVPSTGTYDRHLYMDGAGNVWFGVYNNGYIALRSQSSLNDGSWHMAVGSVGPAGTKLYIDGVLQASNSNTAGESTTGVWRAGCGNLGGWGGSWNGGNSPTTSSDPAQNRPFLASLDEFSVFTSQLSDADVRFLYFAR